MRHQEYLQRGRDLFLTKHMRIWKSRDGHIPKSHTLFLIPRLLLALLLFCPFPHNCYSRRTTGHVNNNGILEPQDQVSSGEGLAFLAPNICVGHVGVTANTWEVKGLRDSGR